MTGSLQKKTMKSGNVYFYIVLNTKPSPKWIPTGLQVKGNKREAVKMLNEVLATYNQKEAGKSSKTDDGKSVQQVGEKKENIMFSDWLKKWLDNRSVDVRSCTSESYEVHSRRVISYFEERKIKLVDVTYADIEGYCNYMLTEGKVDKRTGNCSGYAIRTVRSQKFLISAALDWAVLHDMIPRNPAIGVKVSSKKNRQLARKPVFFNVEEANLYLQFLKEKDDILYDVIYATLVYGLRRSEALGLTVQALDFERKKLCINRTVVKMLNIHDEEDTKTYDSEREYPLTEEMEHFFRAVLAKKRENKFFYGNKFIESDFLFTWEDGHPFSPDYLSKHHKKMVKEFGKPNLTFHNLRHSTACILYEQGWKAKDIQEWLGHADIYTTLNIYTHIDRNHKEKQANSLNGLLEHSSLNLRAKQTNVRKVI
ncbi:MAG: tyrosine-type recombinase/integrase [Blautia sp.]|uniref:tyrosine-type recombinase/integrase n=1 Tax=Blautia sp. TaxID=1955243 RepID=UPI0039920DA3